MPGLLFLYFQGISLLQPAGSLLALKIRIKIFIRTAGLSQNLFIPLQQVFDFEF
jgi:hypothetical protein